MAGHLPADFVARVRLQLAGEADAFLASFALPPPTGLRVNTLKLPPGELLTLTGWPARPVPWCPAGLLLGPGVAAGKHPFHAAGLYYLQEPTAMAVAEAAAPDPGDWVLDLCAAPGGKATHLASLLAGTGLLVANEVEPARAQTLVNNLERWGLRNALVTNESPARLAQAWGPAFDRVVVDAPCSGEGMFRKNPATAAEWSPEAVAGCAARQRHLLATAAELVRPGGVLVYSTCTFAPEENEGVVDGFLAARPDFACLGRERLWPHRVEGEGHFVARLRRGGGGLGGPSSVARSVPRKSAAGHDLWRQFAAESLNHDPFEGDAVAARGERVFASPREGPAVGGLKVVRAGVWLGTAARGRFEPSHTLALTLRAGDAARRLELPPGDPRLTAYMQGHPLREPGDQGWVLVTAAGHPVGWGRRAQGVVKNAYPKGLRLPPG